MARRTGSAIEKAHKDVISATMASTIAGVNPWESPLQLWRRLKGLEPPKEQNLAMWLGTQLEPVVARLFTRETGMKVKRPHKVFDPDFWVVNNEFGYPMACLLDGRTVDGDGEQICEFKTGSAWKAYEWKARGDDADPQDQKIPLPYFFQVQHQLGVTGAQRCYVGALIGTEFFHPVIERDEEIIADLMGLELNFWLMLVSDIEPSADHHDGDLMKARWPHSQPDSVEVFDDPEVERLAREYKFQGEVIKKMEDEREGLGNQLRQVMEDREAIIAGTYKVSAKEQIARRVDTKALKVSEPDIWERFAYDISSRPLRVTERKS